jgi:YHS domain-containing protein
MSFLARIFRFLFWVLAVSWGVWLLRRIAAWVLGPATDASRQSMGATAADQTQVIARRLMRDPVCGMHVDESLAIPFREGSELLHFCSTACRDAHVAGTKKFAASG